MKVFYHKISRRMVCVLLLTTFLCVMTGCKKSEPVVFETIDPQNLDVVTVEKQAQMRKEISQYLAKSGYEGDIESNLVCEVLLQLPELKAVNIQLVHIQLSYAWLDGYIVYKNQQIVGLLSGMSEEGLYLTDLNRDGGYEIVYQSSFGSGLLTLLVSAFDIESGKIAVLSYYNKNDGILLEKDEQGIAVYSHYLSFDGKSEKPLGYLKYSEKGVELVDQEGKIISSRWDELGLFKAKGLTEAIGVVETAEAIKATKSSVTTDTPLIDVLSTPIPLEDFQYEPLADFHPERLKAVALEVASEPDVYSGALSVQQTKEGYVVLAPKLIVTEDQLTSTFQVNMTFFSDKGTKTSEQKVEIPDIGGTAYSEMAYLFLTPEGELLSVGTGQSGSALTDALGGDDIVIGRWDMTGKLIEREVLGGSGMDYVETASYQDGKIQIRGYSDSKDGDFNLDNNLENNVDNKSFLAEITSQLQVSNCQPALGNVMANLTNGDQVVGYGIYGTHGYNEGRIEIRDLKGAVMRTLEVPYNPGKITPTLDGGFIVEANRVIKTIPQPAYVSSIWMDTERFVVCYDMAGEVLWQKTYNDYPDVLTPDQGGVFPGGTVVVIQFQTSDMYIPVDESSYYRGFHDLNDKDYDTIEKATAAGFHVSQGLDIVGNETLWSQFVDMAKNGKNAKIRMAHFFEEDANSPYFTDLYFNEGKYYLFDSSVTNQLPEPYTYLLQLKGMYGNPLKESGVVVLTDNQTLTFAKVMKSLTSSSMEEIEKIGKYKLVRFE